MKKLLLILLALLLIPAGQVGAQTATPTTSPVVHYQGDYWFFGDPYITWSGTWTNPSNGFVTGFTTSSGTAYGAFTVSDSICFISLDWISTASAAPNLLINGTNYVAPLGGVGPVAWVFDARVIAAGDFVVQITRIGTGTLNLYKMQLLTCGETPVPTATAINTSTPAPTVTAPNIDATIIALMTLASSGGGVTPLPTWTPAPTVTPQPTSTPAPTATPQPTATPIQAVIALAPDTVYSDLSGSIVALKYGVNAGQVVNAVMGFMLLLLLLFGLLRGKQ